MGTGASDGRSVTGTTIFLIDREGRELTATEKVDAQSLREEDRVDGSVAVHVVVVELAPTNNRCRSAPCLALDESKVDH